MHVQYLGAKIGVLNGKFAVILLSKHVTGGDCQPKDMCAIMSRGGVCCYSQQELSHLEGHGRNVCQENCVKGLRNGNIVCCPQRAVAQLLESESGKTPNTLVDLLTTLGIRPPHEQNGQEKKRERLCQTRLLGGLG